MHIYYTYIIYIYYIYTYIVYIYVYIQYTHVYVQSKIANDMCSYQYHYSSDHSAATFGRLRHIFNVRLGGHRSSSTEEVRFGGVAAPRRRSFRRLISCAKEFCKMLGNKCRKLHPSAASCCFWIKDHQSLEKCRVPALQCMCYETQMMQTFDVGIACRNAHAHVHAYTVYICLYIYVCVFVIYFFNIIYNCMGYKITYGYMWCTFLTQCISV